jgi:outer membrane protein OmpA-like peptidoglycan-associated protein
VTVLSDPPAAQISYRGRNVGPAPSSFAVTSEDDLLAIVATRGGEPVIERRIRFLGLSEAQVLFRFGTEPSALARRLGLTKILVFENSERVSFDTGKSELRPAGLPILQHQAAVLKAHFPTVDLFVCGHTDSTGGDALNLKLSLERARTVAAILTAEGISRDRQKVEGFGKEFPVDTNESPAGRSVNRRTELVLPQ